MPNYDIHLERDPLWYKDAIIYQTHVKAFYDSNGDGVGDFRGLREKLDYIQDLGINTIWVLPFYPSPMLDDGYDIADYRGIAPQYGTEEDFREFVSEAHRRGLRVITELVINHTSDQHAWFQAARRAPRDSPERAFYIWSDDDQKFSETRIIFTDTERSNWEWDEVAGQYYWHRFFSHQPDLNHNNPEVVDAVIRVMRHWLDMGVDGLRLDAIPYLCVREGTNNENLPETHQVLKRMRAVIDEHYEYRMFLAEANQWPEDVREYFGDGDECHMAYHFPLMPRMFMAIAQEDRHPIVEIMRQTPEIPETCQWAIFLRNHDELTLEMVTDRERDYMYNMYAAEPRMRVNVGIRRRLAPLMDNNRAKIELLTSLLMTMPGSPIIYYGDEIGMGDNIFLGDRNSVRTPMQWTPDRNAGFSRADPQRLYLPPVMDPIYGYQAVNVEAQERSPHSLLNWTKRVIAIRKRYQAFGRGELRFLEPGNRKVLAYVRTYQDEEILCVANLAHSPQPVELELSDFNGRVPVELMSHTAFPPIGELPYLLTVQPWGFYAFRLATDVEVPAWHEELVPWRELPTLVLLEGWQTFRGLESDASQVRRLLATRTREQLQREVLVPYIEGKRWYAAKGTPIERVELAVQDEWATPFGSWLLTLVDVKPESEATQTYFLPLGIVWESEGDAKFHALAAEALAQVRQRAHEGVLYNGVRDDDFCRALLTAIGGNSELPFGEGKLRFFATAAYSRLAEGVLAEPVIHPVLEQSNSSVFYGQKMFLKLYRRLRPGENPELEMGRFFTEHQPMSQVVPVAGGIEHVRDDGTVTTIAVLQQYVENQGDAWHYTLDYLERYMSGLATEGADALSDPHAPYLILMETMGRRLGELHQVLCDAGPNEPAFEPEPVTREEVADWTGAVGRDIDATYAALRNRRHQLADDLQTRVDRLFDLRERLVERVAAAVDIGGDFVKTRYHGDLHLGQLLLVENDFVIIDFEGEPARTMAERRAKGPVLRDVAGILRSLDYAAQAALRQATADRPEDRQRLQPVLREWERAASASFLDGYRSGVKGAACVPSNPRTVERLLDLLVIEKALYEVRYEIDNRPPWVGVPVDGLLRILDSE